MNKLRTALGLSLIFAFGITAAQHLNEDHATAVEKEDLGMLMKLYTEDAVLLPEFNPPVYGKQAIENYYRQRFAASEVRDYHRTMHDSKQVDEYIIETGTLTYTRLSQTAPSDAYSGNYLVVWKADKHHRIHIVAEIWGSDKVLKREESIATTDVIRQRPSVKHKIDPMIRQEIDDRTVGIETAVKNRDGSALAKLYTKDAIYIPYYSPMMVGAELIKQYYLKHEDPAVSIDSVNIETMTFRVVKDIVITTTEYGVRWRAGEHSGKVTGKNLNIWRRSKDGHYLLYRQMANHD